MRLALIALLLAGCAKDLPKWSGSPPLYDHWMYGTRIYLLGEVDRQQGDTWQANGCLNFTAKGLTLEEAKREVEQSCQAGY